MPIMSARAVGAGLCTFLMASAALAGPVVPFTETFDNGVAGYTSSFGTPLTFNGVLLFRGTIPTGGFGASTVLAANFANNPSGGAFIGNYLTNPNAPLTFSFDVRVIAAPVPLTFSLRVVQAPGNFPAVVLTQPGTLDLGNGFTRVSFLISPTAPGLVPEGPPSPAFINGVLSNVGSIQILVNDSAANGTLVGFNFDNISIVPAPGAAGLLGLAGLLAARRRR
ncbi:MAG: hypothetical protein C0475_01695 [Planctomyces sp.]|nr:hypothetical protein [Planctomyces sp.]MBA4119637.1 hypothetical protein [Isosphaera sp.]